MSEQETDKKQNTPSWWVVILFGAFVGWAFNNLIVILTFVATGVVNLSHVGIVPFIVALLLSVVSGVVGFVIAIRLSIIAVVESIAAIGRLGKSLMAQAGKAKPAAPATPPVPPTPPAPEPETFWTRTRDKLEAVWATILFWTFVPGRYRRKLRKVGKQAVTLPPSGSIREAFNLGYATESTAHPSPRPDTTRISDGPSSPADSTSDH